VVFHHVDDAAAAAVSAIDASTPGIYNIVDDEPAPGGRCGCHTLQRCWELRRQDVSQSGLLDSQSKSTAWRL